MADNITAMSHIKHVDIRYIFVNDYLVDGIVKIVIIQSAENYGNILAKNLSGDLHKKHSKKMIVEKPE